MKNLRLPSALGFTECFALAEFLFREMGIPFTAGSVVETEYGRQWPDGAYAIEQTATEQTYEWSATEVTQSLWLRGILGITRCRFITPRQIINSPAEYCYWEADGDEATLGKLEAVLKSRLYSAAHEAGELKSHPTLAPEWKSVTLGEAADSWLWLNDYYLVRDGDPPILLGAGQGKKFGQVILENRDKMNVGAFPPESPAAKSISLRIYAKTRPPDIIQIFENLFPVEPVSEVPLKPEDFSAGCFLGIVKEPGIKFRAYGSTNWWLRHASGRNIYDGFRDVYAIQPRTSGNLAMLAMHEIFGGSMVVSRNGMVDHNFFAVFTGAAAAVDAALVKIREFFYSMGWSAGN